jgi:hypothetical protein
MMSNISVPNNQNPPVAPAAEVSTAAPATQPKGLPDLLISTDKIRLLSEITCGLEPPPQKGSKTAAPVLVAQSLTYYEAPTDGDDEPTPVKVELNSFTNFQLRKLCQHVGITNVSSFTKFECRKRLAIASSVNQSIEASNVVEAASKAQKKLNSALRAVNAYFHPNHFDMLRSFNDQKVRVDHETGNTPNHYFESFVDVYNNPSPDPFMDGVINESKLPFADEENHLNADPVYHSNLRKFDPMDATDAKKKFKLFWSCHKQMKEDMTVSGRHDSDPMKFVDAAMKKVKGGTSLTRYGLFYFYHRVAMHPGIEEGFAPAMLDHLKGDSCNVEGLFAPESSGATRTERANKKRKGNKEETQQQLLQIQRERLQAEVLDSKNRYMMQLMMLPDTSPTMKALLKQQMYEALGINVPCGSGIPCGTGSDRNNNNNKNNNKRSSCVTNEFTTPSDDVPISSDDDDDSDI